MWKWRYGKSIVNCSKDSSETPWFSPGINCDFRRIQIFAKTMKEIWQNSRQKYKNIFFPEIHQGYLPTPKLIQIICHNTSITFFKISEPIQFIVLQFLVGLGRDLTNSSLALLQRIYLKISLQVLPNNPVMVSGKLSEKVIIKSIWKNFKDISKD